MSLPDQLFGDLVAIHELLRGAGIWHVIAYGTLLGAVRDGDLIGWDEDLDLLVHPEDRERIFSVAPALAPRGLTLHTVELPRAHLAIKPRGLRRFDSQILRFHRDRRKVCDLFLFTLFSDGVRRRYDLANEVYWSPHMSFPDFFVAKPARATLRGRSFPAVAHAEKWLTSIYGDWRTPRRNRALGGRSQRHRNIYGHRVVPRLREELAWCEAEGWDRSRYGKRPSWPREVRGGGPIGPTPRTADNSRSLWWRDLDELVRHF